MKRIIILLLFMPIQVYACAGWVIGFKGKNEVFDIRAFEQYANNIGYCSQSYSWKDVDLAAKQIASIETPYQLYGYSLGAVSVRGLLKRSNLRKPEFVLTVGAYRTTDVNFDQYEVKYVNYFDHSGRGQRSPGHFLNVSHDKIQQEVNDVLFRGIAKW